MLESAYFNPLTVDPNSPHEDDSFSLILGLENTGAKAVAMLLYHCGARTLADTQTAFDRHPEWLSA